MIRYMWSISLIMVKIADALEVETYLLFIDKNVCDKGVNNELD